MIPWGIYGTIFENLLAVPGPFWQFSPLFPGSRFFEDYLDESLQGFVLHAPDSTQDRAFCMAQMQLSLMAGAEFICFAGNDRGGKRLLNELNELGLQDLSTASRRHFRIVRGRAGSNPSRARQWLAAHGPCFLPSLGLWSQPGIFSWNRLDPASVELMKALPLFRGRGADLGCGLGVLSAAILKSEKVEHLYGIDIDRRAVAAATKNVRDVRISLLWEDVRKVVLPVSLDFIVSNPPFHHQGVEDRSLGVDFIRVAARLLRKNGSFWLVANRHLPYEAVLQQNFSRFSIAFSNSQYKVIEAIK